MSTHQAALQPSKRAPSLQLAQVPHPKIQPHQILIRNKALALNPIDHIIQRKGNLVFPHIKYPFALGWDVSGHVLEVGSAVTRFAVGDRVLGLAVGANASVNDSAQGGFQEVTVLEEDYASRIPGEVSFEEACVVPLGLATAATALFDKSQLGLEYPKSPASAPSGKQQKTVIVWGGSTSVGCNAIQLAVAAGYRVFTTSSPRNFDYLRSLGATQAWDYNSPSVINDIITAIGDSPCAGAVVIGDGGAESCTSILAKIKGNKCIALVSIPQPDPEPEFLTIPRTVYAMGLWFVGLKIRGLRAGVRSSFVDLTPIYTNGLAKYIFGEFLPKALEKGEFVPSPRPEVAGTGLAEIQRGLDTLRKGVSAKKVVISLP